MFIGIGGVSRAGKSTLAKLLVVSFEHLGHQVKVIHQDDWVVPEGDLPRIKDKPDWETPLSITWTSLQKEVELSLSSFDVVILEGLFAYSNQELARIMDKKFFVRITKKLFKQRKITDLRWGSTPEPNWYIEHIWTSYRKFGIPNLQEDYHILDGSIYFPIDEIVEKLKINT